MIVPTLASPRWAWPAAVNTPRAMALAGPGAPTSDMIWTYSVPEAAREVAAGPRWRRGDARWRRWRRRSRPRAASEELAECFAHGGLLSPVSGADIAVDARRGQRPEVVATNGRSWPSARRPIPATAAASPDWPMTGAQHAAVYRDGVHLSLADKRQRDWLVADRARRRVARADRAGSRARSASRLLGSAFAVVTCATVAVRQAYPTAAGVTAQGLMGAGFCSPGTTCPPAAGPSPGSARCTAWRSGRRPRRFIAGVTFVGLTDLLPVGRDANPANWSRDRIRLRARDRRRDADHPAYRRRPGQPRQARRTRA